MINLLHLHSDSWRGEFNLKIILEDHGKKVVKTIKLERGQSASEVADALVDLASEIDPDKFRENK